MGRSLVPGLVMLASLAAMMVSVYVLPGGGPLARPLALLVSMLHLLFLATAALLDRPLLLLHLAGSAAGLVYEALGTRYCFPYGCYSYTQPNVPTVLGVPVGVAVMWGYYTASTYLASRLASKGFPEAVARASLLAASLDAVMEPAAVSMGFWRWSRELLPAPGPAPLENYLGWMLTVATGLLLYRLLSRGREPSTPPVLGLAAVLILLAAWLPSTRLPSLLAGLLGLALSLAPWPRRFQGVRRGP